MTIATRLNEAMQGGDGRESVSQSELFRRSGVPQPTIARILKGDGKRGPETSTLIALAKALGVEFMWLQQGTGSKFPGGVAPAPQQQVESRTERTRLERLNREETLLISIYRECGVPEREMLLNHGKTLLPSELTHRLFRGNKP